MEDTDYALGRTSAEYDRLIEQAELLRPITERMLGAAGICANMHVFDVGCGVGDVSFLVSALVGPRGHVVGIDLDRHAIQIAKKRRDEHRLANVTFIEGDARTIETGQIFDAAVGRMVLMYMNDPTVALRLIADRVRPGGVVAFQEWVGHVPSAVNQPVLASLQHLLSTTFARSGARLDIGVELCWRMLDAGLEPTPQPLAEIAVDAKHGAHVYRRWLLIARSLLPKIVEYGLATEKEVLHIIEELGKELLGTRGLAPLSWLMIGQWAHKPIS